MKLLKVAAMVALGRTAVRKVRRMQQRQRRTTRRNTALTTTVVIGAGVATYFVAREIWLRREETPARPGMRFEPEPSKKKVEHDAKVQEAKMRDQAESQRPPPEVHVERNATTELKAKLGEVAKEPRRRS